MLVATKVKMKGSQKNKSEQEHKWKNVWWVRVKLGLG